MLTFTVLRERRCAPPVRLTRFLECTILATVLGLLLSNPGHAQGAPETITFDIPALTVPQALQEFARQAKVELAFSERGFEGVRANPVFGTFRLQHALQLLLDGTGLRASSVSGNGFIVRRTIETSATPTGSSSTESSASLLAQGVHRALQIQSASRRAESIASSQAQSARTDSDSDFDRDPRISEEIIVTGSNIRGVTNPTTTVIILDRAYIDRTGFATAEELITSLPQNLGSGASRDSYTDLASPQQGTTFTGGSSVNLRGLGTSSTLVLLNGRRLPTSGSDGELVDISMIPLSAIKRVEVLTDGASAIYGADAIAGVVNFIMRDDYHGAETRLRYGSVTSGSLEEIQFGQIFGESWHSGNALVSYEYFYRDDLPNSEREFAADSDHSRFGGGNHSPPGGNPANILANGETYAIPSGQDGTRLTPADFVPGTQNFLNQREGGDLIPEQEHHSVFAAIYQDLGSRVGGFVEARYTKRETTAMRPRHGLSFEVTDQNPFFVDPSGTGLTTVEVQEYSFYDDLGPSMSDATADQYGGAAGVNVELTDQWSVEFHGTYAREKGEFALSNSVNAVALADALVQTDPQLAFNPFGDGASSSEQVINALRTRGAMLGAESDLWSANALATGTLFTIPGGNVRFAGGVEYREESISNSIREGFDVENPTLTTSAGLRRDVTAAYGELLIPFVDDSNDLPGISQLEMSLALRYEDYSDFGSSANPKIGIVWSPYSSLDIRATYGTSFKAPLLTQLDISSATTNLYFFVPFTPEPALFLLGGNADLGPEEATTLTAGFDYMANVSGGLRIRATYFDIDFDNRILSTAIPLFGFLEPEFAPLVTLDPSLEIVAQFANSPLYQDLFGVSAGDLVSGAAAVGAIVDGRLRNVAKSVVRGIDLQISQEVDSNIGQWILSLSGSHLIDYQQADLPTSPLRELVDSVGNPTSIRLRGSASWTRDSWGATVFVNHTGSYTDNLSTPERDIDSWTTLDAQLSYAPSDGPDRGWLSGVRLTLSAQNLFDEDPPFVNSGGGLAYDSANADGLGRFVSLQLIKEW